MPAVRGRLLPQWLEIWSSPYSSLSSLTIDPGLYQTLLCQTEFAACQASHTAPVYAADGFAQHDACTAQSVNVGLTGYAGMLQQDAYFRPVA